MNLKRRLVAVALCCGVTGCAPSVSEREPVSQVDVEFLYFDGCPVTPRLRASLDDALASLGPEHVSFRATDLTSLDPEDGRLRYGSPTVLVGGRDLMGQPPASSSALACRPYPGGVPEASEIAERIRAVAAR